MTYAVEKLEAALNERKDATMVGFWEKSQKSNQMPYFGQNLVGFLGLK